MMVCLNSLKNKSRRLHYHPNQHTEAEIKMCCNAYEYIRKLQARVQSYKK